MSVTEYQLEISDLVCSYGRHLVLDQVSLGVLPGEISCLLGPSGCGKSTLLRLIAGFDAPMAGEIRLAGEQVSRPGWVRAPQRRNMGMVFQDYALFPHLSVRENVLFGVRGSRVERLRSAQEMIELAGIGELADKYPHEISGGQQQRVALARALAARPHVLLLDEPFSNLDGELRERLSAETCDILRQRNVTALFVTHSQQEAFALADRIAVMGQGRILQWDTPAAIYHRPVSRQIAAQIGESALLHGTLGDDGRVSTAVGTLGGAPTDWPPGSSLDVLVRPEDFQYDPAGELMVRIVQRQFRGPNILYRCEVESGEQLLVLLPSHRDEPCGSWLTLRLDMRDLVCWQRGESALER